MGNFDSRRQSRVMLDAATLAAKQVEEQVKAEGIDATYKWQQNNLFWIMPVYDESTSFPFRNVLFHYNPFHVCGSSAPRIQHPAGEPDKAELSKTSLFDCPVCEETHRRWGRKDGESKAVWQNSENGRLHRDNRGATKTIMYVLDMSPFYTVARKGKNRVVTLNDDGASLWAEVQSAMIEHVKTPLVQEQIKEDMTKVPPLNLKHNGKEYRVGVFCLMLPTPRVFTQNIYPQLYYELVQEKNDLTMPTQSGKVQLIPDLLYISRQGNGFEDIKYDGEVVRPDKPLEVTDDFLSEVLDKVLPSSLNVVYTAPSKEKMKEYFDMRFGSKAQSADVVEPGTSPVRVNVERSESLKDNDIFSSEDIPF